MSVGVGGQVSPSNGERLNYGSAQLNVHNWKVLYLQSKDRDGHILGWLSCVGCFLFYLLPGLAEFLVQLFVGG